MIVKNVLVFFGILVGFVLGILLWKKLKPKDMEIPEFKYKEESAHNAPDIPIDASMTWGNERNIGIARIGTGRDGVDMSVSPEMREPTDVERYRSFIEKRRREEGARLPQPPNRFITWLKNIIRGSRGKANGG